MHDPLNMYKMYNPSKGKIKKEDKYYVLHILKLFGYCLYIIVALQD